MKTIRFSATEARNNFFNILNQVLYEEVQVIIGKLGTDKEVILMSKNPRVKVYENRLKTLDDTFGSIPDFPDVTTMRNSRKQSLNL